MAKLVLVLTLIILLPLAALYSSQLMIFVNYLSNAFGTLYLFESSSSSSHSTIKCQTEDAYGTPIACCPPGIETDPIAYVLPKSKPPIRIRPAAHLVDSTYIEKYNRAYELLRALPDSDPRKLSNQALLHCAYCSGSLHQEDGTILEVHYNWLFLPWHRWFLYFHERILARMLNDDTFTLPFWNWDDQSVSTPLANVIPAMYLNSTALMDGLRNSNHMPPRLVDLHYEGPEDDRPRPHIRDQNNNAMYQHVVSGSKTPSLFLGKPKGENGAAGTIQYIPHGCVHTWTGSDLESSNEDMGALYSAGRDPIFYAHHANVDRIWEVWKTIPGGRRTDLNHSDWLNTNFFFYDENARLVKVRVADSLDTTNLGYRYQQVNNPWVSAKPSTLGAKRGKSNYQEFGEVVAGQYHRVEGKFTTRVKRPDRSTNEEEEVLVIRGVEFDSGNATMFDVFINLPNANRETATSAVEYAGTFVNVPSHRLMNPKRETTFRIGISNKLEQLGITEDYILVTIVSKRMGKTFPVIFKGVHIEREFF